MGLLVSSTVGRGTSESSREFSAISQCKQRLVLSATRNIVVMAKNIYSTERAFCVDYALRHMMMIAKQPGFVSVLTLDTGTLKTVLDAEQSDAVKRDHELCNNCSRYFQSDINELSERSSPACASNTDYIQREEIVDEINECISRADIEVTPLRNPASPKRKQVESYVSQKQSEIGEALGRSIRRRISDAYAIGEGSTSSSGCCNCSALLENIRSAYQKSTSHQERCQLLTLLPENMTKKDITSLVPEATKYMVEKSRSIRAN